MRLIDKDKFLKEVKQRHYTPSSIKLIESQKEVEAISIKWLKKWERKHDLINAEELLIKYIIDDWRKENE